jgi:damage-control phosphatase, subfamily II, stand-alone protein
MARLAQLIDPQGYRPCEWDLKTDVRGRAYWLDLFRWHLDAVVVPLIEAEYAPSPAKMAEFRADYLAAFAAFERHPETLAAVDVLQFTLAREDAQLRHGFLDPFRRVKEAETDAALALLPGVLAELDSAPKPEQIPLLITGLMAGNIFDLGARATVEAHRNGQTQFHQTRERLPTRPWLYDDETAWRTARARKAYQHAVFFVDNAGSDIVLGCLPLVRDLLAGGTRVTLAANSEPALNDVTAPEVSDLLARAAPLDRHLAAAVREKRISVAATGNRSTLIDLSALTDDFVAATADADLLILHGMGRAIESNFSARFRCDVLRTAILKDEEVARHLSAKLLDCVFRFEPGPPH